MQALHEHIDKDGFRLRGVSMSRIDAFSDVVFGFALTLIVVSLEVPHTYDELHTVLLGFIPFGVCFLLFAAIWRLHFKFFRAYGLHDTPTVFINFALLFTVLLYVYPLKFLFTLAVGHTGPHIFSSDIQRRELMIVYGAGFAAIYLCFAALYWNAWRQRLHLRLSPLETVITVASLRAHLGVAFVGLLCCFTAWLLPPLESGRAGYCFLLLFVWGRVHDLWMAPSIRRAHAHMRPEHRQSLHHSS